MLDLQKNLQVLLGTEKFVIVPQRSGASQSYNCLCFYFYLNVPLIEQSAPSGLVECVSQGVRVWELRFAARQAGLEIAIGLLDKAVVVSLQAADVGRWHHVSICLGKLAVLQIDEMPAATSAELPNHVDMCPKGLCFRASI